MTLPQYLLARADSKWNCSRLLGLRPAVNAYWPVAHVLGVVAVQTVLFVAIGFALSFLIYHRMVGLPMWWLGLFAACRGIVAYGLTALCWNQRVARLRVNPDLPTGLPRSRFLPGRWLLRLAYFLLLNVVTPLAMWTTVENLRGKLAWERFKHEWEAKGEKFDFASAIPPPVPDDQNFALTPLLRPIYDFVRGTNGFQWRDTNGYAHFCAIRLDQQPKGGKNRFPDMGNLEKGTLADLEAFRIFFHGNTNYPQPATAGTAAQDVLTALGKFDADLNELSEAANKRPYSRFPIHYEDEPPSGIMLPHLGQMKYLCQTFQLRAIARLELGRADAAITDLKTSFRLSDSIRDEPLLIDHLVRLATLNVDLQGVREGLVRRAWNDAQLAELEKYLGSLDVLAEYKHAMGTERCCTIAVLDYLARSNLRTLSKYGGGRDVPPMANVFKGYLYQNMIETARMYQQFLIPAVDAQQHRVFREMGDSLDRDLPKVPTTPDNILVKMLVPSLSRASQKSARAQTSVDEARVACALERYRLAHGRLPDTLDALTPQFIEKIPNDVIDGKPLRYRKNSDGSYVIYSIGWNQTDDGGIVVIEKGSTPGVDAKQGDWVWQIRGKD